MTIEDAVKILGGLGVGAILAKVVDHLLTGPSRVQRQMMDQIKTLWARVDEMQTRNRECDERAARIAGRVMRMESVMVSDREVIVNLLVPPEHITTDHLKHQRAQWAATMVRAAKELADDTTEV